MLEKNLSYDLQSNVPAKIITADGNLLARLFDNLIGNAIKYGADGKRVLVKIRAEEDVVTVSVTNYGYVIPPEELPLIFQQVLPGGAVPFQQYGRHGPGPCHCKGDRGHARGHHQGDQRFGRHRVHGEASGDILTSIKRILEPLD